MPPFQYNPNSSSAYLDLLVMSLYVYHKYSHTVCLFHSKSYFYFCYFHCLNSLPFHLTYIIYLHLLTPPWLLCPRLSCQSCLHHLNSCHVLNQISCLRYFLSLSSALCSPLRWAFDNTFTFSKV